MPRRRQPLLIAHRGESHDAPENTLAAINLAWQRGARSVEVDLRRSEDGELVVIHDVDTGRIGGPRRPVSSQTLAELRSLDAGSWKHSRWSGERIPLLTEVLMTVPSSGRLFLELKEGPDCVAPLVELLARNGIPDHKVAVLSFDVKTVEAARAALPTVEICQLLAARDWVPGSTRSREIAGATKRGCGSLGIQLHERLRPSTIQSVHTAGLGLYVWTVNRPVTARRLAASGIDGIATDRCAWLAERLRETFNRGNRNS